MLQAKLILIALLISASTMHGNVGYNSNDIIGVWLTHTKKSKITIFKSGNSFYGKVSWMQNSNTDDNKPKVDEKNPDEKLRSRHIFGLLILKGFEYDEKNKQWVNGEIYDPKNGKTYSCKMTLVNNNTLEVHGYIGISLIGRTETWTRSE